MRTQHRLNVSLTLLGPILTRGGVADEAGIDAPLARDGLGKPMLPYSLVKGKVLDALRDLRPNAFENYEYRGRQKYRIVDQQVGDWFGREPEQDSPDSDRGSLRFSDFVTDHLETRQKRKEEDEHDNVIERIQIDQDTGGTKSRMLAMLEAPFGYGEEVTFNGSVEFVADEAEAKQIRDTLDEALRWVPAYGSQRTVGFGRTHAVDCTREKSPRRSVGVPSSGTALPLRLTPDRPLCLVGPKHARNHFESLEAIPGAVLKGALAQLLLELAGARGRVVGPGSPVFPKVAQHFEAIRFAEAKPMIAGAKERPIVPPLSLVLVSPDEKGKKKHFRDVALMPLPDLIEKVVPAFATDWKDEDRAVIRTTFGFPDMETERRTRTAIDENTGRAKDQLLFSYGLVLPKKKKKDDSTVAFVWETIVGLESVPSADRPAVAKELAELLAHGLPCLGKTRATAAVEWLAARTAPAMKENPTGKDGVHVVTLQTECLMTDPKFLKDNASDCLERAYRDFWHDVSGGSLKLLNHFARQALYGGHLAKRTRRDGYEPFLLTERGSVFVLEVVQPDEAKAKIAEWRAGGLPTYHAAAAKPHWKTCPFLPHVGFGEVAIDLACHTASQPLKETPS